MTAAYPLHIHVRPFFDEHDIKLLPVVTDRGSEFFGNPERHEYELNLTVEDTEPPATARSFAVLLEVPKYVGRPSL